MQSENITVSANLDTSGPNITLMIYFAADNNLWEEAQANLADFQAGLTVAGNPANLDIYILMDCTNTSEHYTLKISNGTTTRTDFASNPDSGASETLGDFVDYAMTESPDNDFSSLILWNHGGGIGGAMQDEITSNIISVPGILDAIGGKGIDVVGFDACLMATAEVVAEFGSSDLKYLVASEELEGGDGWNYSQMAQAISSATSEYELAKAFWSGAVASPEAIQTISVSDLSKAAELIDAMNRFALTALELPEYLFNKLLSAANSALFFGDSDPLDDDKSDYSSTDLADFLKKVIRKFDSAAPIVAAAQTLLDVVGQTVLNNYSSGFYRSVGGLSAFLPTAGKTYNSQSQSFENLAISADNSYWNRFVKELAGRQFDDSVVRSIDTGLAVQASADGVFLDLGFFTGGGTEFNRQSIFEDDDPTEYLFQVQSDWSASAAEGIRVAASEPNAQFTYSLRDMNSGVILASGSGRGEFLLTGNYFSGTGNYILSLESDTASYFTVTFDATQQTATDRYEMSTNNDTIAQATAVRPGYNTGLLTSSADPDYYRIITGKIACDELVVSGKSLTADSLTVQLINSQTGEQSEVYWDEARNAYIAEIGEADHILIQGNGAETVDYDFNISIKDYPNDDDNYFFAGFFDDESKVNVFTGKNALVLEYAGMYSLDTEEFYFSGKTANITLYDGNGKKAASGSIKNGKLSFKPTALLAGSYTVKVDSRQEGFFFFSLTEEELFRKANLYNDDWTAVRITGDAGLTEVENAAPVIQVSKAGSLMTDWVGFSDRTDYRKLELVHAGEYFFNLTGEGDIKLTVYTLEEKNGSFRLKTLRSGTFRANDDENQKPLTLKSLLLQSGTYYISVTAVKEKSDVSYAAGLDNDTRLFTKAENSDDDWQNLGNQWDVLLDTPDQKVFADEWVGFGDAVDFRRLEVAASGHYSFDLETGGNIRTSLYVVNAKGKLTRIKTLSVTGNKGSGTLSSVLLDASNTYYIMTESTNAKSGKEADYEVSVNSEETELYAGWDLVSDARLALDLEKRGFTYVALNASAAETVLFEDLDGFTVNLYRYNAQNNKLSSVGIKKGEAVLDGTYYLKLTAKDDLTGSLVYDSSAGILRWENSAAAASPFQKEPGQSALLGIA